jgi:hypothetical protein
MLLFSTISRIVEKNIVYDISIGILAWGVVLATVSIGFSIQSYSLRSYKYAVGHEYFFDEKGNYKEELDWQSPLKLLDQDLESLLIAFSGALRKYYN